MFDIVLAAISAVIAVGVIQFLKNVWKTAPRWVWQVALPVLVVALVLVLSLIPAWLVVMLLALAIAQLGYETIVKLLISVYQKFFPPKA
jgi:hypothetical protein